MLHATNVVMPTQRASIRTIVLLLASCWLVVSCTGEQRKDTSTQEAEGDTIVEIEATSPIVEAEQSLLSEEEENRLDNMKVLREYEEMNLAIKGLSQDVLRMRELSKIYRATGEERYKTEALRICRKAQRLQTLIREAEQHPEGKQVIDAGDMFIELERIMSEF